ncbi:hypothetical protein QTP86_015083 [Hemibagrus guttatus]|nr:hypothetical protein QTP86_015083 [Hemibagrus guttatus]
MPFGLTNGPAVFQALINEVFQDILGKWVIAYIDDILVYLTSLEEHVHHVRAGLSRLQQNHLYVKPEKCAFHQTTITFLGYVISWQGVKMDLTKVHAVTEWPNPTTIKELPLVPGVRQILPAKLTAVEANYDVGNRELLSIKAALEEWRHWLAGARHPFLVLTDHRNLEYLRSAKCLNPHQARWALFFTRFEFSVTYRPGTKKSKADAPGSSRPKVSLLSPISFSLQLPF